MKMSKFTLTFIASMFMGLASVVSPAFGHGGEGFDGGQGLTIANVLHAIVTFGCVFGLIGVAYLVYIAHRLFGSRPWTILST
jgi:hypothetical protein